MNCKDCGEHIGGDGYQTVVHCPNADYNSQDDKEPDAEPVHCDNWLEEVSKRTKKYPTIKPEMGEESLINLLSHARKL